MMTQRSDPQVEISPDPLALDKVLAALADPVRLEIVAGIDRLGEASCSDLDLPVSKATASHHFRILRAAGIIATRREGTSRISHLRHEALDAELPGLLLAVLERLRHSRPIKG